MRSEREPLISVIIPVYNVEEYLDRSMETVVAQTYQNLEIILVNDGSTDNSGQLCDKWAAKDARIRVIHQNNGGPSCARNAALDIASGEYILFSDSDDLLSSDLCKRLYLSLTEDCDIAICDFEHVFPNVTYSFSNSHNVEYVDREDLICKMWYQTGIIPSACAKLYRKEIFAVHRFTPGLIFEDIDLLHELFWQARKIAYVHARLYGYVHRSNSITTTAFSQRDMDIFKVTDRILRFCEDRPDLVKAARAYAVVAALRVYLNAPPKEEFSEGISQAKTLLCRYGKEVLRDSNIRIKNRYALWLYFGCKPLLQFAYQHINRWK